MPSGMIKGTFWKATLEQARKLGLTPNNLRKAKEQFVAQRKAAKRRKIEWRFDFEEWVLWWVTQLGSNWQELRGKTTGKYCMARPLDKGPYAIDNVKCILTAKNVSEQVVNGSRGPEESRGSKGAANGRAKITDQQALEIYSCRGSLKEVSKKFGVTIGIVNGIKSGRMWRHITNAPPHKLIDKSEFQKGVRNGNSKLDEIEVIEIFQSNENASALSRRYKISRSVIQGIRFGKNWSHITSKLCDP